MPPKTEAITKPKSQKKGEPKEDRQPKPEVKEPEAIEKRIERIDLNLETTKESGSVGNGVNIDVEKKIKALKKKLREIDELAKKELSQLNSEQIEKLSKRSSIEDELRHLEDSKIV